MIHLTLQAELVYPCCVPHIYQQGSEKALMRTRYLGSVAKDERICSPGGPGRCGASWGPARQRHGDLNKLAMGGLYIAQHHRIAASLWVVIRATRIGNCMLCSNYSPLCFSPRNVHGSRISSEDVYSVYLLVVQELSCV